MASFSCPSPYVLNTSLGLCVEPTPPGFTFVNGQFLRNCPAGMRMNDLGICIRPVMTRKTFISDASIQQTQVAIGANSAEGSSNSVIFGSYDAQAYDVTFQQSQSFINPVTQVKASEGSSSLFLVGQENSISSQTEEGQQTLLSVKTASIKVNRNQITTSQGLTTAVPSSEDSLPASVRKMYYASSGQASGQMYFLGSPSTKVFLAEYNASLVADGSQKPLFLFQSEPFSVSGMTDPYYVGSYPSPIVTDGALQQSFVGALQNGSNDATTNTSSAVGASALDSQSSQNGQCPNDEYLPRNPIDPLPRLFIELTDATSRAFVRDILTTSFGYVIAGYTGSTANASPTAYAMRYLQPGLGQDYDKCTLETPVPKRPLIQTLQNIQLPASYVNDYTSDVRLARFDIESDTTANRDTIYVFGSSNSQSAPILSFISENHSYSGSYFYIVSFGTSAPTVAPNDPRFIGTAGTKSPLANGPINLNGITRIGSFVPRGDTASIYADFVGSLNDILANANTGASIELDKTDPQRLALEFSPGSTKGLFVSLAFLPGGLLTGYTMTNSAAALGFAAEATQFYSLSASGPLVAPQNGSAQEVLTSLEFNGLSTDDSSAIGNGQTSVVRQATQVQGQNGDMEGTALEAWSYDPIGQALAFSIGETSASSGLGAPEGQTYSRSVTTFNNTGPMTFAIPANCIGLEVHLWGAGGSCDAAGTGGSGAYVSGHLDLKKLNISEGQTLTVVVGSGGLGTHGSGGSGTNSKGKGGGRTAIQLRNRDIVTAGGGGGSSGTGQGGAASAFGLAESGLPALNGGQGASEKGPGLGGLVFGDNRFRRAPDGANFRGAPNCSSLYKSCFGAGGGGSGYFGGGAGAYLGNHSQNDKPTGSGGGSSFSEYLVNPVLISGTRDKAPAFSLAQRYKNLLPSSLCTGGSKTNGGLGSDGFALLVATTVNSGLGSNVFGPNGSSFDSQVWACRPKAFSIFSDLALWGSPDSIANNYVRANWSSIFTKLTKINRNPVQTIFCGLNGLVVLVQDGPTGNQSPALPSPVQVTWTFLSDFSTTASLQEIPGPSPFEPLNYLSVDGLTSFVVPAMTQVTSIRQVSQNSLDLLFVGSGSRIIRAPQANNGTWSNVRFIMDASTSLPLAMNLTDSHYSDTDQAIEIAAQPQSLQITSMHKTPWTPQFASFYESSDVVTEIVALRPWALSATENFTNAPGPYEINGLGPVIQLVNNAYVPRPLGLYSGLNVPSSVLVAKCEYQNQILVDRIALNIYASGDSELNIGTLAERLSDSLNAFLQYCISEAPQLGSLVKASVFVGAFGILSITITNLAIDAIFELTFSTLVDSQPWLGRTWQSLFSGTGLQSINEDQANAALVSAGSLLGFTGAVKSTTAQSGGSPVSSGPLEYEASFEGTAGIQLVPTTQASGGPLTPLSLALPVNSTFAGSIYHVYAPTVKLAAVDSNYQIVDVALGSSQSFWPYGLVAAAGGPIASVVHTTITNGAQDSFLDQPVPNPGSQFWIDYVQLQDQQWFWCYADCTGDAIEFKKLDYKFYDNTSNSLAIRSPANILVSQDSGASYGYSESLLGTYLKNKGQFYASFYAQTALDSFHIFKNTKAFGCGPAKFVSEQNLANGGHSGLLNAAVAQFNDIKFVPYEQQYQDSVVPGFFIAVGQFLWELNALVTCAWDTSLNNLYGVAWVSLDGLCWTTIPIVPRGAKGENFWQVFRFDNVDLTSDNATIITDLGLYMVHVPSIMNSVIDLFTNGPILDFKAAALDSSKRIDAMPVGLSGPYAAVCTSRDATGTCIKCLRPTDNSPVAWPVSVPQIIGAGGAIQPNFDTCVSNVRGDLTTNLPYTSVESAVDALAIAAYAGFDKSAKISTYRQSFFSESAYGPSNNSLIICPKLTDVNETPSAAGDAGIADQMQCALDNGLVDQGATYQNVNGPVIVRKSGSLAGRNVSYEGGLNSSAESMKNWTDSYVRESRWLTLVPYDTKLASDLTRLVPDTCPSTLGLGGSTIESVIELGSLDAYPPTLGPNSKFAANLVGPEGLRTAISSKITNKGAFPGSGNEPEDGPFLQNQSSISSSGSWAPGVAPYDRAILANDDLQSDFQYANQGTTLKFNGIDAPSASQPPTQTRNPYLFRLSSYEFPFDAQALRADGTLAITIGRDPQVYEPGFGPLQNYNLKNFPGFARSEYSSALQPWPANPLPEEGFGHWWIRPSVSGGQNGITKSQNLDSINGLYQTSLGYGTLIMQQQLGFYGTAKDHQGYTWPGGLPTNSSINPQVATENLFVYDTETGLSNVSQGLKYFSGSWTKYLPFQDGAPDSFAQKQDKQSAWASLNLSNSIRAQRAQQSLSNILNLKLFNKPEPRPTATQGGPNNWKFLVGLNFFRPRNWAFEGLSLSSQSYGFGLHQQILCSDQPDSDGRYEFLIPDPFFAAVPMASSFGSKSDILGIRPSEVEQDVIAGALGYSSRPTVLNFIETPTDGSASYARNHVAFHYFTIDTTSGTAVLDLFVNVTKLLEPFSSFQWPMLTLQSGVPYDPKILSTYFDSYSATGDEASTIERLLKYNGDPRLGGPLNSFTWSDPSAQTTRSLASMNAQSPGFATFKDSELVFTVEISANALRKRIQGQSMIAADYAGSTGYSLLRHRYTLSGFGATTWPQGSTQNIASLMSSNPNSISLFGQESWTRSDASVALPDARGFAAGSNFIFSGPVLNLTTSDYNVESDNAGLFTSTGPSLNQDLMAQTYPGASQYGSDEYGFGLRIDSDAVKLEQTLGPQARPAVSANTNADLPCDHGYVSMVRTIVDSNDRFTTGKSIDAVPHVARLTYVTKYVPSTLQAYGSVLTYQPMRFMPFGQSSTIGIRQLQGITINEPLTENAEVAFQCCPNPFRIRSTYLIEEVPIGADSEAFASGGFLEQVGSTWLRPPQFGVVNGKLQGTNFWSAFSSNVLDLESPGFWGRMPLPLLNGIGNEFFSPSNMPILSEIYDQSSKYPFAGYEGLWDNSNLLLGNSLAPVVSFRSSFNSLNDYGNATTYDSSSMGGNRNTAYATSLDSQSNIVAGQMLVNLRDAAFEGPLPGVDSTQSLRLELGFIRPNQTTSQTDYYRGLITLHQFFNDFVYNSSGAYQRVMSSNPSPGPLLVTHAELTRIFQYAMEQWLLSGGVPGLQSRLEPNTFVQFTFDPLTDRASFQFNFNSSSFCSMLRLFVPSPLSNWLGLRPVASPMFNIKSNSSYLNYHAIYDFKDLRYQQNVFASTLYNLYSDGQNINWLEKTFFISPWQFTQIAAIMFGTMDPLQGNCESSFTNPQWIAGAGPAIPTNWNFNNDAIGSYSFEMIQNCSTPTRVEISMDSGPLASWTINTQSSFVGTGIDNKMYAGQTSNQVTYSFKGFGNKATTTASPLGWFSNWSTGGRASQSTTDRFGWTPQGWSDQNCSPLYSLFFESSDNNPQTASTSVLFSGRAGMAADETHSFTTKAYMLSDVSNASWCTRLAASLQSASYNASCAHWWGLVASKATDQQAFMGSTTFSAYQADCSLSTNFTPGFPKQTVPSAAKFMGTGGTPATLQSSQATNISACPFLDSVYVPAIEVPCPYGSDGLVGFRRGLTKPANYDSYTSWGGSVDPGFQGSSGSPTIDKVAEVSTNGSSAAFNWLYSTRETYGALVPTTATSTFTGSINSPFQFSLKGLSNTIPRAGLATNTWNQVAPPQPQSTSGAQLGPSLAQSVSDANGLAVFLVSDACFVNVGPTAWNSGGLGQYNRMALWAFNYSDIFASNSVPQPWLSANRSALTGLKDSVLDTTAFLKAYIRGVPYYMDESYDGAQFSTLGRSLRIGPSVAYQDQPGLSSFSGQPLEASSSQPVVLILAPASFSSQAQYSSLGINRVDNLENTFSNSMVYSFTEPYNQLGGPVAPKLQTYSLAFTDPQVGPIYTFYGLDNSTSASQGPLKTRASRTTTTAAGSAQRKVYQNFSGQDNSTLGRDIRQVYPSQSLSITKELTSDPYALGISKASWPLSQSLSSYLFQYVTFENPDWNFPTSTNCAYLPLAGTWNGDRDTLWAGDAVTGNKKLPGIQRQMIPNYEGLALLAEWTSTGADYYIDEVTTKGPGFTLYAVDRKCSIAPPIVANASSQNLLSLSEYNLRRPSTVFVLLCDQWRNTIRMPKTLANSQSRITGYGADGAGGLVPTLTYGDGSGFIVDFVDCMGPSDYNANDAQNDEYYGVCSGTLNSLTSDGSIGQEKSKPARPAVAGQGDWAVTPWAQSEAGTEQVWSPFTGGSFWNTFKGSQNLQDTESDSSLVAFSPNLWWPTYRWALAATDPNNVWPTSVASNPTLQQASYVMFTCTDGTIRKLLMPGSGPSSASSASPFPVIETTNINTFYNNDINAPGGTRAYSFTWPGRLYNLTWFADNWWCTADNSSVWTTAPCFDGTLINDPALVSGFFSSVIKFRPLSANEGHPADWLAASWPANQAHKFNLMKIINFNGSLALVVGSVDGEYIVINQIGSGFTSTLPNTDYAVPWLFPNTTNDDTSAQQTTMLYASDIAVLGNNLVVGSAVLPLDPQANTSVPWLVNGASQKLPLLSLSYSPSFNNGPSLLMTGQHNTWPGTLVDSNVISTVSLIDIGSLQSGLDARNRLLTLTSQLSSDSVGLEGSLDTFSNAGYILNTSMAPGLRASGLKRISRPQGLGRNDPPVFYDNDASVPNGPDTSISTTAIGSFYALQEDTTQGNLGAVLISHQHKSEFDNLVSSSLGSSAKVTTFHKGGFDMDTYTQAFFVSSRFDGQEFETSGSGSSGSSGSSGYSLNFSLGLKKFSKGLSTAQLPFTSGSLQDVTGNWNSNYIRSFNTVDGSGPMPMWNRSLAFSFDTSVLLGQLPDASYAFAYAARLKAPINGPLEVYKDQLVDFNDLNKFQSMNIRRAAAIPANINIVDMALAESAQAFALTLTGPFGPSAPIIAQINITDNETTLVPLASSSAYANLEARFQGPSIIEWNPYELKWYCAGFGTHMPDLVESTDSTDINSGIANEVLRPAGIDQQTWQSAQWDPTDVGALGIGPLASNVVRLMLLSSDASLGAATISEDPVTNETTLEPAKFTQVFQVRTRDAKTNNIIIKPVSRLFGSIDCMAFSPNAVFIGGSQSLQLSQDPSIFIANNGAQACFAWRTNVSPSGDDTKANWSFQSLNVPGTITAAKFVGYAWYIATWNPIANRSNGVDQGQSNLFFASINFTVVTLLDTWTGLNSSLKVSSIDSVTPERSLCSAEEGFEVDPNNPNACVKKCPQGFKAFGNLCVQVCPMPFSETGVPNECQPDVRRALTVSPTLNGQSPAVSGPLKSVTDSGAFGASTTLPYAIIVYYVFFALLASIVFISFILARMGKK